MRNLLIRADGGESIGMGHLMRCRALAQAWEEAGGVVRFASSGEEAVETAQIARDCGAAWVVVDGYHFGSGFVDTLQQAGLRVLFLDDYGHAERYPADLVLNQNLHATDALYARRGASTGLLLGPRYILLRREFRAARRQPEIPEVARKILVTMGGSDPPNATGRVIEALTLVRNRSLEVTVVAGPANPHDFGAVPAGWRIERNHDSLPSCMAWADIAISAGGVTSWELAFMGVPQMILTIADNQVQIADSIQRAGFGICAGAHPEVPAAALALQLQTMLADAAFRSQASARGQKLVDGQGPRRVAELLV